MFDIDKNNYQYTLKIKNYKFKHLKSQDAKIL